MGLCRRTNADRQGAGGLGDPLVAAGRDPAQERLLTLLKEDAP